MKKFLVTLVLLALFLLPSTLLAQQATTSEFALDASSFLNPESFSVSISLLLSLAGISFLPFILVSTTSFLRTVIVLSMIRQAIGTQQAPPNVVIISLALFMTVFVMTPTFQEVNTVAYAPYKEGQITQKQALELGVKPFKTFMLKLTRDKDLALFLQFSGETSPQDYNKVPIFVLIPAFVISELKTAFQIGFLIYIPFIVIDLIVSNILLSLGMFMLSPAMISLPFKILLFVLTDGWNLMIKGLLTSFR